MLGVTMKRGSVGFGGFARGLGGIRPAPLEGGKESRIRFAINSAGEGFGIDG
jgi:hypothetical protein